MKVFSAKLSVLAMFLVVVGVLTARGQDSADSGAAKGGVTVTLKSNGSGLPVKAQFVSGVVELAASNHVFFILLRDEQTGYTWWQDEYSPKNNFRSSLVADYINEFESSFWVVPEIGIAQFMDRNRLVLTDMKTASIEEARRQLIAGYTAGLTNNVWLLEQHQKEIRLPLVQTLGDDFFSRPMVALPSPTPKVLSLGFINGTWSIKLESVMAKTNRIAVVELNSEYKVLKATRSNLSQ